MNKMIEEQNAQSQNALLQTLQCIGDAESMVQQIFEIGSRQAKDRRKFLRDLRIASDREPICAETVEPIATKRFE